MDGKTFIGLYYFAPDRIPPYGSPYPYFIFTDVNGLVLGEYMPWLRGDKWAGEDKNAILEREILTWYITWDQQDIDTVQFWITMG